MKMYRSLCYQIQLTRQQLSEEKAREMWDQA